jgi:hypothetical protein
MTPKDRLKVFYPETTCRRMNLGHNDLWKIEFDQDSRCLMFPCSNGAGYAWKSSWEIFTKHCTQSAKAHDIDMVFWESGVTLEINQGTWTFYKMDEFASDFHYLWFNVFRKEQPLSLLDYHLGL